MIFSRSHFIVKSLCLHVNKCLPACATCTQTRERLAPGDYKYMHGWLKSHQPATNAPCVLMEALDPAQQNHQKQETVLEISLTPALVAQDLKFHCALRLQGQLHFKCVPPFSFFSSPSSAKLIDLCRNIWIVSGWQSILPGFDEILQLFLFLQTIYFKHKTVM